MSNYLQAMVTILALINPAICAVIFSSIEAGRDPKSQAMDATRAAVVILIILSVAALAGAKLLSAFGISLDAFQVAGGAVLVWMGFSMLTGSASGGSSAGDASTGQKPSLTALVMFAASPGTITGVITVAVTHAGHELPITAVAGSALAVGITWLLLLASTRMSEKPGGGAAHEITARFMGLIVLAMGMQFALSGLQSFFAAT